MTKVEFNQFMALSKKFQDHINTTERRAEWFKTSYYEELKENYRLKQQIKTKE